MTRLVGLLLAALAAPAVAKDPVPLFDGKDLGRWYTFLRDHGKDQDPNGTFAVKDGVLRVSGQDFGGLITRDEYANYTVVLEYTWGGKVWPGRDKMARDSGLLVHATGADGAASKTWLNGYQVNMLEGATGDLSITGGDKAYRFTAEAEERPWGKKTALYWKAGAAAQEFVPGRRLVWAGRDTGWENVLGFRGKNDVEKKPGEWNTLTATLKGDTLAVTLNGVEVSRAAGLTVTRGKLLIQSEGSEVVFRKITLTPLD